MGVEPGAGGTAGRARPGSPRGPARSGSLRGMSAPPSPGRFHRIAAAELRERIASARPPLLLDVRRRGAFRDPPGIPGALPFPLDREPVRLPDLARDHPLVASCL